MFVHAFSTSTPKPRAEGSNPSAPAKDLARNSLEFRAFLVFWGGGDAVYDVALYGVYFALFSFLFVSVSSFSVWYIINKSSKIWGALSCFTGLGQKLNPSVIPCRRVVSFLT